MGFFVDVSLAKRLGKWREKASERKIELLNVNDAPLLPAEAWSHCVYANIQRCQRRTGIECWQAALWSSGRQFYLIALYQSVEEFIYFIFMMIKLPH